ncbi:MAG TPA: patatin-like phospholipase family protein [Anaerolineaceae bacterium]|nr:patatin-like phospholipase family protein [Longilinea sp.]NMD31575.1 patatin-like phospholipase family protein [Chloroflexota bacterium]HNZ00570.1 patatin-like phospholipase family protein [Anaerolineaceae bacterium]HOD45175.1 patatin-like phospholipase family protein [Anaerolineaceae bacterium]HOH19872.1 patatin-like phospholipase family protein [Anaerolineaceae bacterium]
MKPFRKHVALAIDGGGIRGIVSTRALSILEEYLGTPCHQVFQLAAGTSTGSIISAGIGARLTALELTDLYLNLGEKVFPKSWRTALFPLSRYRYHAEALINQLAAYFGHLKMGDFWTGTPPFDIVITSFDLLTNHTMFIKPWKEEYRDWQVVKAVQASCTVPTYFPLVDGRYIDGGVGAYANPCYLAAYEACFCLAWEPSETTLISLGTGRSPHAYQPEGATKRFAWEWLTPIFGAFLQSADDQQVHLVDTFFDQLDFRRFQVDMDESIEMDDTSQMPLLLTYGNILGEKIINDHYDRAMGIVAPKIKK